MRAKYTVSLSDLQWKCIVAFLLIIITLLVASHFPAETDNYSHAANLREKRVLSVSVERNDSLWSIAKQYYTPECGDFDSYIREIKTSNALESDVIYAGGHLIIPVWATDREAALLTNK